VAASIAVLTMPISASASFGGCGARRWDLFLVHQNEFETSFLLKVR
jgi:hypothetical protein